MSGEAPLNVDHPISPKHGGLREEHTVFFKHVYLLIRLIFFFYACGKESFRMSVRSRVNASPPVWPPAKSDILGGATSLLQPHQCMDSLPPRFLSVRWPIDVEFPYDNLTSVIPPPAAVTGIVVC